MARLAGAPEALLQGLCALYLRSAVLTGDPVSGVYTLVFTPPLTPGEQTTFNRLQRMVASAVQGLTLVEWQALEADIVTCKAFVALAAPTVAQHVAATKAHMRITAAILRS